VLPDRGYKLRDPSRIGIWTDGDLKSLDINHNLAGGSSHGTSHWLHRYRHQPQTRALDSLRRF
jgi:hypothetical protein